MTDVTLLFLKSHVSIRTSVKTASCYGLYFCYFFLLQHNIHKQYSWGMDMENLFLHAFASCGSNKKFIPSVPFIFSAFGSPCMFVQHSVIMDGTSTVYIHQTAWQVNVT